MKYGKLKVTVDYGDGFTSETTYHAWSFDNEGTTVSALTDVNAVDHAAQIHYDVDVTANPQGIFGTASNVTYSWVEEPAIIGLFIEHGDNLNDYTEPGIYARRSLASDSNIVSNVPDCMGSSMFLLEVYKCGNGTLVQRCTRSAKIDQAVAQRVYGSGGWGAWQTTYKGDKVLWQGGRYMTADHVCNLSENVSAQKNGLVLVFAPYVDGEVQEYDLHCEFVPKKLVELQSGKGMTFNMANSTYEFAGSKYLYIYDDRVSGHANNNKYGTGVSGVKYTNSHWVLRYILGV